MSRHGWVAAAGVGAGGRWEASRMIRAGQVATGVATSIESNAEAGTDGC